VPPFELSTPRLSLRPARSDDLAAVHRLWTAPAVRRFLFDGRVLGEDEVRDFLARSDESFRSRGYGLWLGFEPEDPALAAFAALLAPADPSEPPSLIYGVRPAGRGLATEAARAVLAHAFGALALPRVHADVDAPNAASVRVLEKLGMVRAGERVGAFGPLLDFTLDAQAFRAGRGP
jgi:ribosomal-protein-alanine N-acetyltransferase